MAMPPTVTITLSDGTRHEIAYQGFIPQQQFDTYFYRFTMTSTDSGNKEKIIFAFNGESSLLVGYMGEDEKNFAAQELGLRAIILWQENSLTLKIKKMAASEWRILEFTDLAAKLCKDWVEIVDVVKAASPIQADLNRMCEDDIQRILLDLYYQNVGHRNEGWNIQDILDSPLKRWFYEERTVWAAFVSLRGAGRISKVAGRTKYFKIVPMQLDKIREFVKHTFEKSAGGVQTVEQSFNVPSFEFVSNEDLAQILARDYEEIQKCLSAGCYKAVLVFAGSTLESLLLDALLKQESAARSASAAKGKDKDLRKWYLATLIDVAAELNLIHETSQNLSSGLRKYRNLIHPGYELRQDSKNLVGRSQAITASSVLDTIMGELEQLGH